MSKDKKSIQIYPAKNFRITIDYLSHKAFCTELAANEAKTGKVVESRRKGITSDYTIYNVSSSGAKLTEFDRAVLNAAIAEQIAGNEYTTPAILYHQLGGGHVLTRAMRKAIMDSIERLASVRINVEMEEACKELGYGVDRKKTTFKGYLLPTESLETQINGKDVTAIHFLKRGIIFSIADMKNQMITCERDLLEAPIRHSERGIALNHYFVRRALEIKGSHGYQKSNSNVTPLRSTILFEDILEKCGFENLTRRQRQQIRETAARILQFLVDKKIVSSFEIESAETGKVWSVTIKTL